MAVTGDTTPGRTADERIYMEMQQRPEFQELKRKLRSFVFPMTAVFLAWYLLYVLASAYARDFMGHRLVGHINVAFVFGVLQFVSTFLIAWLYSRYANRNLDPIADRLRAEIEQGESR